MVGLFDGKPVGKMLANMQRLLKPYNDRPLKNDLLNFFNVGASHPELAGLLLSRNGVCDNEKVNICKGCFRHLKSCKPSNSKPPKFAIKNKFEVRPPPKCLKDLNEFEMACISPAQMVHVIRHIQGDKNHALTSHTKMFMSHVPLMFLLPRDYRKTEQFEVSMSSCETPEQMAILAKKHIVDPVKTWMGLNFLLENNWKFKDVAIREDDGVLSLLSLS